jgi:hypothetical protein
MLIVLFAIVQLCHVDFVHRRVRSHHDYARDRSLVNVLFEIGRARSISIRVHNSCQCRRSIAFEILIM